MLDFWDLPPSTLRPSTALYGCYAPSTARYDGRRPLRAVNGRSENATSASHDMILDDRHLHTGLASGAIASPLRWMILHRQRAAEVAHHVLTADRHLEVGRHYLCSRRGGTVWKDWSWSCTWQVTIKQMVWFDETTVQAVTGVVRTGVWKVRSSEVQGSKDRNVPGGFTGRSSSWMGFETKLSNARSSFCFSQLKFSTEMYTALRLL